MCRTPRHQQDQDALSAQIAVFIAGGGAIQALDSYGRPAGVATEDLPSLPGSVQEGPTASPLLEVCAEDATPAEVAVRGPDSLIAELRDIRLHAQACLARLNRAVTRRAHE